MEVLIALYCIMGFLVLYRVMYFSRINNYYPCDTFIGNFIVFLLVFLLWPILLLFVSSS